MACVMTSRKTLLPGQPGTVGVTAADNRLFIEAVLYRFRAGIPLPERHGNWKNDFSRWAKSGFGGGCSSVSPPMKRIDRAST